MKIIKFFLPVFLVALFLINVSVASAATYKNSLPQKDWVKYGINPWRLDTDFDGYNDDWEVKNDYCPTNLSPVRLDSPECEKGIINLRAGTYIAPKAVVVAEPRPMKNFSSCAQLFNLFKESQQYWADKATGSSAESLTQVSDIAAASNISNYFLSWHNDSLQKEVPQNTWREQGNNFFVLDSNNFYILGKNKAGQLQRLSSIALQGYSAITSWEVSGSKLIFIGLADRVATDDKYNVLAYTLVQVWDMGNKAKPYLQKSYKITGMETSHTIKGGTLYLAGLATNGNALGLVGEKSFKNANDLSAVSFNLALKGSSAGLATNCRDWQYWEKNNLSAAGGPNYLAITALPLAGRVAPKVFSFYDPLARAVFAGGNLYVLNLNATMAADFSSLENLRTEIYQYDFSPTRLTLVNSQTVPGVILTDTNILSHKNNLVVISNEENEKNKWENKLYIFDNRLNKIGWYDNFGSEYKVRGAYFRGDELRLSIDKNAGILSEYAFDLQNMRLPDYQGLISYPTYAQNVFRYDLNRALAVGVNDPNSTTTPGFADKEGIKLGWVEFDADSAPQDVWSQVIADKGSQTPAAFSGALKEGVISQKNNIFALPVTIGAQTASGTVYSFFGWYVYKINPESGLDYLGGLSDDNYSLAGAKATLLNNKLAFLISSVTGLDTGDDQAQTTVSIKKILLFNLDDLGPEQEIKL